MASVTAMQTGPRAAGQFAQTGAGDWRSDGGMGGGGRVLKRGQVVAGDDAACHPGGEAE